MKRQNKKQGKKSRPRSALPLTFVGPRASRATVVFSQEFALTEGAASVGTYRFYRANSIYDPDYTGTGTVVMGYAQLAASFQQYRVDRVRIRVEGVVANTSSSGCSRVGLIPAGTNPVISSSTDAWTVQKHSAFKLVAGLGYGGSNKVTLDKSWNLWNLYGVTRKKYEAESTYTSTFGNNPADPMYVALWVDGINSTVVSTFSGVIVMSFEVFCFNPVQMAMA